jgi:hypothetical protein
MPSDGEVTQRTGSLRALTGRTAAAGQALLPPFAQALMTDMDERTMDGHPRTSRRDTTDGPCPWPTRADNRLVMLTDVKQHRMQAVQGQLFGRSPSHANTWSHLLHPVVHHA